MPLNKQSLTWLNNILSLNRHRNENQCRPDERDPPLTVHIQEVDNPTQEIITDSTAPLNVNVAREDSAPMHGNILRSNRTEQRQQCRTRGTSLEAQPKKGRFRHRKLWKKVKKIFKRRIMLQRTMTSNSTLVGRSSNSSASVNHTRHATQGNSHISHRTTEVNPPDDDVANQEEHVFGGTNPNSAQARHVRVDTFPNLSTRVLPRGSSIDMSDTSTRLRPLSANAQSGEPSVFLRILEGGWS